MYRQRVRVSSPSRRRPRCATPLAPAPNYWHRTAVQFKTDVCSTSTRAARVLPSLPAILPWSIHFDVLTHSIQLILQLQRVATPRRVEITMAQSCPPQSLFGLARPQDAAVTLPTHRQREAPLQHLFIFTFLVVPRHAAPPPCSIRLAANPRHVRSLTSIARGGAQRLFDVTATCDPKDMSVALTTRRRRVAPLPGNFYYVFGRPADHSKRRVLQLRVNLNLYSIFERLACTRRVRYTPHVSAARSAAPAVFITFLRFPRTRLRVLVLHSGFNVLFGFPANPRHVRRAPHASAARSAGPAIFITFLGFPRIRLRVLESHSGFTGARRRHKARSPLLFDVRVLREPNDDRTLGASMACGGGAQRCLQRLFDVRVSRELNDVPFAFPTRRRRAAMPPSLFLHFWWSCGAQRRTQVLFGFPRTQDVSAVLHTRRRRVPPPPQFLSHFWASRRHGYMLQNHTLALIARSAAFGVYSMSESPTSLTTRPSRSRRVGGAQRRARIYCRIFGGPAARSAVLKSYSASREPKTRPARSTRVGGAVPRTRLGVTACGGGAQRCLWFLFDVRASHEPNDAHPQSLFNVGASRNPPVRARCVGAPPNFNYFFGGPADQSPRDHFITNQSRPLTRRRCLRLPVSPKTHTAGLSRTFYLDFWRSRDRRDAPSRRDALPVAAAASHRSGILNFGFGLPVSAAIFLLWIWYSREQVRAPSRPSTRRRHHAINAPDIQLLDFAFPRAGLGMFVLTSSLSHSLRHAAIFLSCLSSKPALSIQILDFKSPRAPSSRRRCPDILLFGFRVPASEVTLHAPARRDCAITPINVPANI
ncbi:hypothetical protein DFH09DRAFT_1452389 [Mycena vulgaris]|nr:hypothetical protein DFH09DRAFT_1452389 [Mycena vulgaris]